MIVPMRPCCLAEVQVTEVNVEAAPADGAADSEVRACVLLVLGLAF